MLQLYLPLLSDSLNVSFTGKKVKCQQHEKLQTLTIQRSVNKSSTSMRVNFVYKGLLYVFFVTKRTSVECRSHGSGETLP